MALRDKIRSSNALDFNGSSLKLLKLCESLGMVRACNVLDMQFQMSAFNFMSKSK